MIKILKINNQIHTNFNPYFIDEEGNKTWNIPTDVEEFRKMAIDTINWWIGNKVKKQTGNTTKLSASNSKAIVLLTKVLSSLNPDLSNLTDLEKSAWDKLTELANNKYADSELLNNSLQAVQEYVIQGSELLDEALQAKDIDELIVILNKLF